MLDTSKIWIYNVLSKQMTSKNKQKGDMRMSEREKELIQRIAKNMPSLNDSEQQYVIGVVDGIALAKSGIEENATDSSQPAE